MNKYLAQDSWGESYLASYLFGADLARELGGTLVKQEDPEITRYTSGDFMLPGGLQVCVAASSKKKGFWRISASVEWRERSKLNGRFAHTPFPEAYISASKSLAQIAKEVKRRVIEPAKEPLAKVTAQLAELASDQASIGQRAAELRAKFPWLSVTVKDGDTEAQLYANGGAVYFYGRLSNHGSIYVDRIGSIDANRVERLLAALAPDA